MPNGFCNNPARQNGIVYQGNNQQMGGSCQNFDDVNALYRQGNQTGTCLLLGNGDGTFPRPLDGTGFGSPW